MSLWQSNGKEQEPPENWEDYKAKGINNFTSNNINANVKTSIGFAKEGVAEAPEAILLTGPFAGENPGNDLVAGMTEDLGAVRPVSCDCDDCDGDSDGVKANSDSLITDVGGAISGWNRCSPAALFQIYSEGMS